MVGTIRQFEFTYSDVMPFVLKTSQLGQNLLMPPNVKGWPGYTDWINATTLLERKNFSQQLFRTVELRSNGQANPQTRRDMGRQGMVRAAKSVATITFDPDAFLTGYGGHTDREPNSSVKTTLAGVLLASKATQNIADGTVGVAYLKALTLDPAYQLK